VTASRADEQESGRRYQLFLQQAGRALARGNLEKTHALCRAYLARVPNAGGALFVSALAALLGDDPALAAAQAVEALEAGLQAREPADLVAVVHALAGDLNGSAYWGKIASTLPPIPELAAVVPPSVPPFAEAFCDIRENPLLAGGRDAMARGGLDRAEHWFRQHLAFFPDSRDGHLHLACCLLAAGRPRAAADGLRAARHRLPDDAELASLLGHALTMIGRFAEAAACHRWAMRRAPDDVRAGAARLRDALLDPRCSADELAAGFRAWGQAFGDTPGKDRSSSQERTFVSVSERPLTVGFLVGNEAGSPIIDGLSQILSQDRSERMRFAGFGIGALGNSSNIALQKGLDRWIDVADTDARTLAVLVQGEGIDVLIDLAGFSAPRLLKAFGGRMAPCQAAWLNTPYGTGLANMDFLLTDSFVDPDAPAAARCAERLVPLELGCVPLLATVDEDAPPAVCRSTLLFAADATLADLNPETIACWAEILHRVPEATLLLGNRDCRDEENLAELLARFGAFGISHRVDLSGADTREALFRDAEIVLLPFPFPQPEAAALALRLAKPVVCPAGEGRHRRIAASVLHHLGLAEQTIAADPEAYADLAVEWAKSPERREEFSGLLPSRISASAAADGRARARDLEAAIQRMWLRDGCTARPGARP